MAPRLGARLIVSVGFALAACSLSGLSTGAPQAPDAPAAKEPHQNASPSEKPGSPPSEVPTQDITDILGADAACFVCHIPFVKEELALEHRQHGISCSKCHGPSTAHANDENIGATKPDITYTAKQIDSSCLACHVTHDITPQIVIARFLDRRLPPTASINCTQCHGQHKIEGASQPPASPSPPTP